MNTTKEAKWHLITTTEKVPVHEGRRVRFQDYDLALFNLGDDVFRVIDNACPHKQGPLVDGIVAGKSVYCPLHNLKIHLETGQSETNEGCVKVYPVRILKDQIYVSFEQGSFCEQEEADKRRE